jgi:type I restriction enzyme, R subunit
VSLLHQVPTDRPHTIYLTLPRHIRKNLTEEELTIFDILTKPEPKLTKAQENKVKKIARELLTKLKAREKLILNWRTSGSAAAGSAHQRE